MPIKPKLKVGKTSKHYSIQNDIIEDWNDAKDKHYIKPCVSDTYAIEQALVRDTTYLKNNKQIEVDE